MIEEGFYLLDKVQFSSDVANIVNVERLIDEVVNKNNLSEELYGNILIAVTEAVNNAIVHGNKNEAEKTVTLEVSNNDKQVCFTITDDGVGFDFDNLPDPTSPENIEKITGRGVFLMKNLADKLSFSNNGATVSIYFNL